MKIEIGNNLKETICVVCALLFNPLSLIIIYAIILILVLGVCLK